MKRKGHAILYSVLGLCVLAAAVWGWSRSARAEGYQNTLSGVYDSAYLSALDALRSAQYKLEKALLSDAGAQQAQLLAAVSADARSIGASLSVIPLSHTAIRDTIKFSNQLSDFSASLIRARDTVMTADEQETARSMIDACERLHAALSDAQALGAQGADDMRVYFLEADGDARPLERAGGENGIQYPTLIYDGPFSDARETGAPKALGTRVITYEEAERLAREFVGDGRVTGMQRGTESGGVIPTFGVTVRAGDVTLEVAVTKTGGKVLWMMPDTAHFEANKSVEECRASALQFLESRGYLNMTPTYFQVYEGLAVVNFAATQGNCVLYPDLIKVQVRMDTAQVVGLEANHYLMNHVSRFGTTPALSAEDALGAVSALLSVESTRLAIIPDDYAERLCWEFKGQYRGHVYLVYIDANTGVQADILRLIEDGTGILTI